MGCAAGAAAWGQGLPAAPGGRSRVPRLCAAARAECSSAQRRSFLAHAAAALPAVLAPRMAAATAAAAVPVAAAREEFVDVTAHGKGDVPVRLWLRTWGNRASGIPVLFVHGGPGNCVADYKDINADFFDNDKFFVVEPDQRGTGRSTPSVRESAEHMQHYLDISLEQMSADFEASDACKACI